MGLGASGALHTCPSVVVPLGELAFELGLNEHHPRLLVGTHVGRVKTLVQVGGRKETCHSVLCPNLTIEIRLYACAMTRASSCRRANVQCQSQPRSTGSPRPLPLSLPGVSLCGTPS